MDNYQLWQIKTYGSALPQSGTCEMENGASDAEKFLEALNNNAEQELINNN